MTDDAPPSTAADLWDCVKYWIRCFGGLFGCSDELAQTILLSRDERDNIALWLRIIETMLRRVLMIEAAALPKPVFKSRAWRPRSKRVRRVIEHIAEAPEHWCVRFHLVATESHPRGRGGGLAQARPISAWPLAERLEALLRVVENPGPHIARAARALHRRPEWARRIAKPFKHKQRWAEHSLEEFDPLAEASVPVFCNTS